MAAAGGPRGSRRAGRELSRTLAPCPAERTFPDSWRRRWRVPGPGRRRRQAANVFTTDGQLASGDYELLDDPKRLFGFQHMALVIDQDKLERLAGDRFMRVINAVNRRLTTSAMIEMNRAVEVDNQDEACRGALSD